MFALFGGHRNYRAPAANIVIYFMRKVGAFAEPDRCCHQVSEPIALEQDGSTAFLFFFGHVLFQFLCNLQQYCNSAYNKLNSLQKKEFINITKMNYIWKKKKN